MSNAAKFFFDTIKTYADLEALVSNGESENIFLECKAPEEPKLNNSLQITLAKALSGFSNTNGGVVIWGASTTKKAHSDIDLITQIEPIGHALTFSSSIINKIPTLTTPSISKCENKVIKKIKDDSRGVVITYVPPHIGDPVQSLKDDYFYYRSGDDFTKAPHQMLKRLFAATDSPDLFMQISEDIINLESGIWHIPIILVNKSSAVAENTIIQITVVNGTSCSTIQGINGLRDMSHINPGKKIFSAQLDSVIHRGLKIVLGSLKIKMNGKRNVVKLDVNIFANKMVAKKEKFVLRLLKRKFVVEKTGEENLY